jgi:hypothetical protein
MTPEEQQAMLVAGQQQQQAAALAEQAAQAARNHEQWIDSARKKLRYVKFPHFNGQERGGWRAFKLQLGLCWETVSHPALDEEGRKLSLLQCLEGAAATRAAEITLIRQSLTYSELEKRLDQIFEPPSESNLARLEFQERSQTSSEPLLDYVADKVILYNHGWPDPVVRDPQYMMDMLIKGVRNASVRRSLTRECFSSLETFKERALFLVAAEIKLISGGLAEDSSLDGLARSSHGLHYDKFGDQPMDIAGMETRETRGCYNCGRSGHLARDCKSKPKEDKGSRDHRGYPRGGGAKSKDKETRSCHRCNAPGHLRAQCYIKEEKLEAARKRNKDKQQKGRPRDNKPAVREVKADASVDSDEEGLLAAFAGLRSIQKIEKQGFQQGDSRM